MNNDENDMFYKYIQASIEAGINKGVETAMKNLQEERRMKSKRIQDNRLYNTRLLLKNYRKLVNSVNNAVFKESDVDSLTVADVLHELEQDEDLGFNKKEIVIESILKSRKRTEIMIEHIKKTVNFYMFNAQQSGNASDIELSNIIYEYYINPKSQKNMSEMSAFFHKSERQLRRDIARATSDLAILIFGIDGLNCVF